MIQANQQEKRKAWDYQKQQIELRWKRWGQHHLMCFNLILCCLKTYLWKTSPVAAQKWWVIKFCFSKMILIGNNGLKKWCKHGKTMKIQSLSYLSRFFLLAEHEVDFIEKQHELMFALSQIPDAPKVSIQQWTDGLATINQLIDSHKETVALFMGWSLNDEDSDELYSEYAFWLLGGTNLRQIDHENIWCKIMRPVTIDRHEPDEIKLCIHQLYDAQVKPQSYQSLWYEGLEQKEHTLLSQAVALEDNGF